MIHTRRLSGFRHKPGAKSLIRVSTKTSTLTMALLLCLLTVIPLLEGSFFITSSSQMYSFFPDTLSAHKKEAKK